MLPLDQPIPARIRVQTLGHLDGPHRLIAAIGAQRDPAILDSAASDDRFSRTTILACRPIEVLTLRGDRLANAADRVLADTDEPIWTALSQALTAVRADASPAAAYAPGWIGYAGYELGRRIERLPQRAVRDTAQPDLRWAFYDALLLHDRKTGRLDLADLRFDRPLPGAGRAAPLLRDLAEQALAVSPSAAEGPAPSPASARTQPAADARPDIAPDDYRQAVARCIEHIAAGDIFQVNLSQRFRVPHAPPPLDIYLALRRRNPAAYAAFLRFTSDGRPVAICSSSPELFLRVEDGRVLTRPIKGTRPRTGDPSADARAQRELLHSAKDNAELAMIIDLLRNDLGRVCRYGSVQVASARTLETHPTVYHLVGEVEGHLADGVGPAELLRATFPGGSITGAPKIRAMEIIDELEPVARGVYTGSIGIVDITGRCEWNIVIRTIVCDGPSAYVQVGGGIVADSTPEGEYQETLDKARALLEAIHLARARADANAART